MSFDFSTLVTDRTQADVAYVKQIAEKIKNGTASESELAEFNSAAMKGAYNYTDLNRVTAAMEALKAKLEGYGYAVPGYQRIKVPHPEFKTSRLPEGYTELAWIESTGTQYIDTGFVPNQDTRVVCDCEYEVTSTASWLFGVRIAGRNGAFAFLAYESKFRTDYGPSVDLYFASTTTKANYVDKNKNVTTVNGSEAITDAAGTFNSQYNLVLFACNTAGTISGYAKAKIKSCQIYDNGTLIREFVPCKNSGGVFGLYEMVNAKFYANAGTGSFAAGEEIAPPADVPAVDEFDPYLWYEFDWPTTETMTVYLLNVAAIRAVLAVMKSTPSVPVDMVGLMVQESNNIEKILVDVNELLEKSALVWFYSGDLFAGEVD